MLLSVASKFIANICPGVAFIAHPVLPNLHVNTELCNFNRIHQNKQKTIWSSFNNHRNTELSFVTILILWNRSGYMEDLNDGPVQNMCMHKIQSREWVVTFSFSRYALRVSVLNCRSPTWTKSCHPGRLMCNSILSSL